MNRQTHILIVDPIAFNGGSKIATKSILKLLDKHTTKVTVVTNDAPSWDDTNITTSPLFNLWFLKNKEQGLLFFCRHALYVLSVFIARVKHGKFHIALGASGPGVDLSIYMAQTLFGFSIVQLVHGPVAKSKTIGRAFLKASKTFYLASTKNSIITAIQTIKPNFSAQALIVNTQFKDFENGLSIEQWPKPKLLTQANSHQSNHEHKILWTASLLKWKGLDLLIKSLQSLKTSERPKTHICYIQPPINEPSSPANITIPHVKWHQSPVNLNSIRAECSIFISTSKKEPFGLSILEAMAAGLVIVIPSDGAFWDTKLTNMIDCLKYQADDFEDLARKIMLLNSNPILVKRLSKNTLHKAQQYRAETVYKNIVASLSTSPIAIKKTNKTLTVEAQNDFK